MTREPAAPKDEIVLCAYNVERGLRLDEQLRAFGGQGGIPSPDVLLLSEADRGCTRSGSRNVAREYARELGMYYVYGVEFIELPRFWGPDGSVRHPCEHGNAIVSRFPLGNVRLIRHRRSRSWNNALQRILHVGEPRLGGRIAVAADVRIGEHTLRVYSVHFESPSLLSRIESRIPFVRALLSRFRRARPESDSYREAQARELIEDASGLAQGVVMGGDMNVIGYLRSDEPEPVTSALVEAGYQDAHAPLALPERASTASGLVIDLIFGRGVRFIEAGVGPRAAWGGLSDHLPVWARIRISDE